MHRVKLGVTIGICLGVGASLVYTDRAASAPEAGAPPENAAQARFVTDTSSALRQTAAIVEATLIGKNVEFSEETGPWTRYEFSNVEVHRGAIGSDANLVFYQEGGFYPDGYE